MPYGSGSKRTIIDVKTTVSQAVNFKSKHGQIIFLFLKPGTYSNWRTQGYICQLIPTYSLRNLDRIDKLRFHDVMLS